MAEDIERNRQETGEPETSGQHGNPSGQQQGQLDQQKKVGKTRTTKGIMKTWTASVARPSYKSREERFGNSR